MEGVCREVGVHHQQLLGRRPGVCRLHSLLGAIHCKIIRFLCQVYIIVESTIEIDFLLSNAEYWSLCILINYFYEEYF